MLFSVIVPTYNRGDRIKQTIESVLTQSYSDFEVIIVDDGSTDNTESIIKSLTDNRIKYYKIENSERGAARNIGFQISSGDYVNFFDSDDLALNKHLKVAANFIKRYHKPPLFHLNFGYIDDNKRKTQAVHVENINTAIFKGNCLSCNGVFIRRDVAERNPFNEDRKISGSEDYLLWLRLASQYKFASNNEITSYIVNHDGRSQFQINYKKIKSRKLKMLEYALADPFISKMEKKKIQKIETNTYSYISLYAALAKEKSDALSFFKMAFKNDSKILFSKRGLAIIKRLF